MLKRTAAIAFRISIGITALAVTAAKIGLAPVALPNWIHLYSAYLMQRGDSLYDLGSGPVFLAIYPPLATAVYLPVTWIRESFAALTAGSALTAFYYFLPAVLIVRSAAGKYADSFFPLAAFLLVTFFIQPLQLIAFNIHADAATMMFCALACFVMQDDPEDASFQTCFTAAFLAALAVWTKQTSVPIFAALAVYAAVTGGIRRLGMFAAAAIAASLLVTGAMLMFFERGPLFEGIWTMPSRQPMEIVPWTSGLLVSWNEMCAAGTGLVLAAGAFLALKKGEGRFYRSEGSVYLWAALCFVPTALYSNMKIGGSENTIASPLYFAALFIAMQAARLEKSPAETAGAFSRTVTRIAGAALILAVVPYMVYQIDAAKRIQTPVDSAARAIREHPGEYYFPYYPLLHLFLEKKTYHSYYGLWDRALAGLPVSHERLVAGFPEKLKYVAWPPYAPPWAFDYLVPLREPVDARARLKYLLVYEVTGPFAPKNLKK